MGVFGSVGARDQIHRALSMSGKCSTAELKSFLGVLVNWIGGWGWDG